MKRRGKTVSGHFTVPNWQVGSDLIPHLDKLFGGLWWVADEAEKVVLLFSDVDALDTPRAEWFIFGWLANGEGN